MTFRTSLVSAAALAVVVVTACVVTAGGGAAGTPKGLPSAKLALMPLPLTAYGREAARLKLDANESGVIDNADAADGTTDRKDSSASLKAAGRITGFDVTFADYSLFAKPGKLVFAWSGTELSRSPRQASAGIARTLRDRAASDPAGGLVLLTSARFPAPGLGDDAHGFRVAATVGSANVWFTGVIFRRAELIESVGLVRTDSTPQTEAALALAHALDSRVEGVLAGRITTPPVNVPPKAKAPAAIQAKVPIASAALTVADLRGAKVTRQEYVHEADTVSAYEREFDRITYGSSRLLSTESDVSLYTSPGEAVVYLDGIRGVFNPAKRSFKQFIMGTFAQGAGFKLKSFSVVQHRPSFTLPGTKGTETVLHLVTPLGPLDVAYVFMASGKFVGTLIVTSAFGGSIAPADLARLGRAFARRMQATSKQLELVA